MNALQMMAKLYDIRDALVIVDGEKHKFEQAPYVKALKKAMATSKLENMPTAIRLADLVKVDYPGDSNASIVIMRILCAAVEMQESEFRKGKINET